MAREKVELILAGDSRTATTAMKRGEQGQKGFEQSVKRTNTALTVNEQRLRQQAIAAKQSQTTTQALATTMRGMAGAAGAITVGYMALDRWSQRAINAANVTAGLKLDMDAIAAAADNMATKLDLSRGAMRLQNLHAEVTSETAAKMAGQLAKVADAGGHDLVQSWEQLGTALQKGNVDKLRSLGLLTDNAAALDAYAKATKQSTAEITIAEKQQIALNEALRALEEAAGKTEAPVQGLAFGFQRAKNRAIDFLDALLQIDVVLADKFAKGVSLAQEGLEKLGMESESARQTLHALDKTASMVARVGLGALTLGASEVWRHMMKAEVETTGLMGALEEMRRRSQQPALQREAEAAEQLARGVAAVQLANVMASMAAVDQLVQQHARRVRTTGKAVRKELSELEQLLGKGADSRFDEMTRRTSEQQAADEDFQEMLEGDRRRELARQEALLEIRIDAARRSAELESGTRNEVLDAEQELLEHRMQNEDDELEKLRLQNEMDEVSHQRKLDRIAAERQAEEEQAAHARKMLQQQQQISAARQQLFTQGAQMAAQSAFTIAQSAQAAAAAARAAGESESEARRQAIGEGLKAVAVQLGAMAIAEGIRGAAMLITLNPMGALHLTAAGIYAAGAATLGGIGAGLAGGGSSVATGGGGMFGAAGGGASAPAPNAGRGTGPGEVPIPPSPAPGTPTANERPNQGVPDPSSQRGHTTATVNINAVSFDREAATQIGHTLEDLMDEGVLQPRRAA